MSGVTRSGAAVVDDTLFVESFSEDKREVSWAQNNVRGSISL